MLLAPAAIDVVDPDVVAGDVDATVGSVIFLSHGRRGRRVAEKRAANFARYCLPFSKLT